MMMSAAYSIGRLLGIRSAYVIKFNNTDSTPGSSNPHIEYVHHEMLAIFLFLTIHIIDIINIVEIINIMDNIIHHYFQLYMMLFE